MTADHGRVPLRDLMDQDELERRATRIVTRVEAKLARQPAGRFVLLGHPIVAAAAVVFAVALRFSVGSDTAPSGSTAQDVVPLAMSEEAVASLLPRWMREE